MSVGKWPQIATILLRIFTGFGVAIILRTIVSDTKLCAMRLGRCTYDLRGSDELWSRHGDGGEQGHNIDQAAKGASSSLEPVAVISIHTLKLQTHFIPVYRTVWPAVLRLLPLRSTQ